MSAVSSPFVGFAIDRLGKRPHIGILAGVFLTLGHVLTAIGAKCDKSGCSSQYYEVAPLVLVGLGYSIYGAAIWASIPYVVKPQTLGTAFGVTTAVQNGGLALFPTIGGAINKATLGVTDA